MNPTRAHSTSNEPHQCCAHVSLVLDIADQYEKKAKYLSTGTDRQKALAEVLKRIVFEIRAAAHGSTAFVGREVER